MKKSMRMLLTLVALLLTFAMCFAVVGCDKKDKDDKDDDDKSPKIESPQDVADAYLQASFKDFDTDAVIELYNKDCLELKCENEGTTILQVKEQGQEIFEGYKEMVEEKDAEIYWEIVDVRDVDYDDSEYELFDLYEDELDTDVIEIKIVEVDATLEKDGESDTDQLNLAIVNIDDEWYLGDMGLIGL